MGGLALGLSLQPARRTESRHLVYPELQEFIEDCRERRRMGRWPSLSPGFFG